MASTNKTTNYGLNQWVGTDLVKREDFNSDNTIIDTKLKENADALESHKADNLYQTSGGTATAITLTISGTLVTGYPITFIASANNNGAATTINGKPLYKPGTTTAPTLMSGKAYTVWYNTTSNCFFIKASAEGNTIPPYVLAGTTFTNDNDVGLVGTMPDYSGGDVVANNITGTSPGWIHLRPPQGYHGNGHSVYWNDANFIASNIVSGKSIFGVAGSATIQSLGGKRFATGTATLSGNDLVVTGLPFTPSKVIVWYAVSEVALIDSYRGTTTGVHASGGTINFNNANDYISGTSFYARMYMAAPANSSVTWWACE